MKVVKIIVLAMGFASLASFGVQAATINFADFAAANEGGVGRRSLIDFGGGISIRFSAAQDIVATPDMASGSGSLTLFPYFDGPSGGLPGGLGVCRELAGDPGDTAPGAECADSSDDSLDGESGVDEAIILVFRGIYDLTSISFRDGNHNSIDNSRGLVEYYIGGPGVSAGGITTFDDLVQRAIAGEFAGAFQLWLGYIDTEFYLETISLEEVADVPIPAALPLLISGFAAFGFISRRKRRNFPR